MGKLTKAAEALVVTDKQEYLSLAADLAKIVGQNTLANHIGEKVLTKIEEAEKNVEDKTEGILQELPSRVELLLKDVLDDNNSDVINGDSESEK